MRSGQAPTFYVADGYCAEESVGYMVKRVGASIVQQVEKRLESHDLTMAQWMPLFKIKLKDGMVTTVVELARDLQSDVGATTRLLDRLEKKELCRRVRSTEDRRVVKIELTDEGQAVAKKVEGVLAETLNDHLAGFTTEEWQALKSYLLRMIANGASLRDAAEATTKETSKA